MSALRTHIVVPLLLYTSILLLFPRKTVRCLQSILQLPGILGTHGCGTVRKRTKVVPTGTSSGLTTVTVDLVSTSA